MKRLKTRAKERKKQLNINHFLSFQFRWEMQTALFKIKKKKMKQKNKMDKKRKMYNKISFASQNDKLKI